MLVTPPSGRRAEPRQKQLDSNARLFENDRQGQRQKRDSILNAAYRQFSHYSFRKTSMEDIAQAAGISRALIYSDFQNKDDIFRNVSIQLHDQAERMALAGLASTDKHIAARIEGALIARHGLFQKIGLRYWGTRRGHQILWQLRERAKKR